MRLYLSSCIIICILSYVFLNNPHIEHYTEQSDIRILHLVLYSSSIEYDKMYLLTRDYYKKFNNIITIYYTFSLKYNIITLVDDILYIPGNDTYLPGILDKTIKAFLYCDLHYKYDYIVRSNISTIVNFNLLSNKLNKTSIDYGGGQYLLLRTIDVLNGITNNKYFGTYYVGGTAIIFSNKMIKLLLLNKDKLDYSVVDDVAIGVLIKEQFPDIAISYIQPMFYNTNPINMSDIASNQYLYYRNKTNNRMNDVNHMKQIIDILNNLS